jgi:hypothetical protein
MSRKPVRLRPQKMCKKPAHSNIPAARNSDLCVNCLKMKEFGDQTMRGKGAGK